MSVIPKLQFQVDKIQTTLTAIKEDINAIPRIGNTLFYEMIDKDIFFPGKLRHEIGNIPADDRSVFQGRIKALVELIHNETSLLKQFTIQTKAIGLEAVEDRYGMSRAMCWGVRVDDYQFLISHYPYLKSIFDEYSPQAQYDARGFFMYQVHPIPGGLDPPPFTGAAQIANAKKITFFDTIPHTIRLNETHHARIIILYRELSQ